MPLSVAAIKTGQFCLIWLAKGALHGKIKQGGVFQEKLVVQIVTLIDCQSTKMSKRTSESISMRFIMDIMGNCHLGKSKSEKVI